MAIADKVIHSLSGREVSFLRKKAQDGSMSGFMASKNQAENINDFKSLNKLGIHLGRNNEEAMRNIHAMKRRHSMDADVQQPVTSPSINVPVQFLQHILPGVVQVVTNARLADEIIGMSIAGTFEQEQIVAQISERMGVALPYNDDASMPYASFNTNWIYRTIVNFSIAFRVGIEEDAKIAALPSNISAFNEKRIACINALEIQRNILAFFGFNNGANFTYGFLNDDQLSAYETVPFGDWFSATFLEIQTDLLTVFSKLRTQSGSNVDPHRTATTLALASDVVDYLGTTSELGGKSVMSWLNETYPRVRVVSAPELDNANGAENVGYLSADEISDGSTDGGKVWDQPVQTKYMMTGIVKDINYTAEGCLNSTAGALCKRPYAVVRFTGI